MAETKLITTLEEFETERRKGIGVVLPQGWGWREANIETIKRFGDGIGDYNPLWMNEEYAKKGRFGMLVAPPSFVFSLTIGNKVADTGTIIPDRISTQYFPVNYAGTEMEFFRPIWVGDRIRVQETVGDVYRKVSQRVGPILFCKGLNSYYNQRQELVATSNVLMARYLNIGKGIEYDRKPKAGAVAEPADPLAHERKRRGAEPRYWEDVTEGEELPTLKKGTYTATELFFWTMHVGGARRTTRAQNEAEGSADLGGSGRFDAEHALKRRNMPGQFDVGPQRISWLIQMVTDWMGDDATLKKHFSSIRQPNIVGDTNTVKGKVVKKYIENGEHLVEVEVGNENQAGAISASARATVVLPSKGKK